MRFGGGTHPFWRWAFIGYALLLAVLTHWPGLAVDVPIHRPDLLIHAGVFAVWTLLLERSGLLGRFLDSGALRWRRLVLIVVVAAGIAALDEWTQQFVGRVTAMDDLLANWIGVGVGLIVIVLLGLVQKRLAWGCPPPDPVADRPPERG